MDGTSGKFDFVFEAENEAKKFSFCDIFNLLKSFLKVNLKSCSKEIFIGTK